MTDEQMKRQNLYDIDRSTVKSLLRALQFTQARQDKMPVAVYQERMATIRSRLWHAICRIIDYELDHAGEVSSH